MSEKGSLRLSAGDTTQTSGLINVARGQPAGEKFWCPWEPSLEVRERLSFPLPVDNELRACVPAKGSL